MEGLLVFGRTGQVARELSRIAPDARFLGREDVDHMLPEQCAASVREIKPTAVINAAAYTAVDKAETEQDTALLVNARAPGCMAQACAELNIPFLHLSTDYVFDGSGSQARNEHAVTGPLGVYGATKLAGEQAVAAAGGQWTVLRTSWVFSAHGTNFVRTMLRLGAERPHLTIVADQVGGPTSARAIAQAAVTIVRQMLSAPAEGGLYHFSGAPDVSWADFAREIFRQAALSPEVVDISTSDYPTPARRPLNSRLDCSALERDFTIARPDWRWELKQVLKELQA